MSVSFRKYNNVVFVYAITDTGGEADIVKNLLQTSVVKSAGIFLRFEHRIPKFYGDVKPSL